MTNIKLGATLITRLKIETKGLKLILLAHSRNNLQPSIHKTELLKCGV